MVMFYIVLRTKSHTRDAQLIMPAFSQIQQVIIKAINDMLQYEITV